MQEVTHVMSKLYITVYYIVKCHNFKGNKVNLVVATYVVNDVNRFNAAFLTTV